MQAIPVILSAAGPTLNPDVPHDGYRTICRPVVDLWSSASRDSERLSQLLMGAPVAVIDWKGDWIRVESDDRYRGWMEARFAVKPVPTTHRIVVPFAELADLSADYPDMVVRLPMGCEFALASDGGCGQGMVVLPDGTLARIPLDASAPKNECKPTSPANAARFALRFLGTPYLWGGSSAFGFDCSGLVQFCYRQIGVVLRRDADIQRSDTRFVPVQESDDRVCGDLVFFGKADRITHVGLDLGDGRFVHSAGGSGVIVTPWGDDRFSPSYVDSRRLDMTQYKLPPERHEDDHR